MPIPDVPSWIGDLAHLNGLSEAALATDRAGQIIFANKTARRLYRFLGEDLSRVGFTQGLLAEGQHEIFDEIAAQALAGDPWSGRLDVRRIDGSVRPADVSVYPLSHSNDVVGLVCIVDDNVGEEGAAREARRLEARLTRLAHVAAELATAQNSDEVGKIVVSEAADAVGATVASIGLVVDEHTMQLLGLRGGLDGAAERWSTFSLDDPTPARDVVRSGKMMLLDDEEISRRYPGLESAAPGPRTLLALPLRVVGSMLGIFTLSFPGHRDLDAAELEFLGLIADSCAQALERVRARDEAEEQSARVRYLAEAATELSRSLDYAKTLTRVAKLAVPNFADWCAIDLVEDNRLHRLAVEHVDPAKVQFAHELQRRYPPDPDSPGGPWEVIRTGRSSHIPEVTDEMLVAGAQDEEHLRIARELNLRSAIAAPLTARGRVLGVITWVAAESGRHYTTDDVEFAEDLARRCALAIDNAQLYSQTMEAAVRLQDAVLPELGAEIPGWEVAHFYSPSGRTEVGGDFFDAIPMSEGRLALFVGDVMGRGVAAAASMAQMRAAIRAYIAVDPDPASVVERLDKFFRTYGIGQLVTLVYAVADPGRDTLHVVNAGHPPPVVRRVDGATEQLPMAEGAPLGLGAEGRSIVEVPFHPGDTVVAFTDGLIERRDEDIDEGQRRLLELVPMLGDMPLDEALSAIVESTRDHTREDDVAALAVRRAGWLGAVSARR
ncbi:MAG TPA: SpoIIE family protein phosphatase [Marmoricola sp.]|nr:SpoIIE family protein phosphatase [Marmoricola sp.]